MPDVSFQDAAIAGSTGIATLIVADLLRRWQSRAETRKDAANVRDAYAAADNKTMEALTNAFRAISERQADDINDLRERLRRVEDALLIAHARNEALQTEVESLRTDVLRLREERDLLAGEVRQLKQVAVSTERVYGPESD